MRHHQRVNVQHAALEHWGWFRATKKGCIQGANMKTGKPKESRQKVWENDTYWTRPLPGFAPRCQRQCWSEPRLPQTGEKGCRREGERERESRRWSSQSQKISDDSFITWWLPVVSVQAVHQFRKDARFDEIINRGVTVTWQQLPRKANTSLITYQYI